MARKTEMIFGLFSALLILHKVQLSSTSATGPRVDSDATNSTTNTTSSPLKDMDSTSKSNILPVTGKVDETLVNETHLARSDNSTINSTKPGMKEEAEAIAKFVTTEIKQAVDALTCSFGFCGHPNSTTPATPTTNTTTVAETTNATEKSEKVTEASVKTEVTELPSTTEASHVENSTTTTSTTPSTNNETIQQ